LFHLHVDKPLSNISVMAFSEILVRICFEQHRRSAHHQLNPAYSDPLMASPLHQGCILSADPFIRRSFHPQIEEVPEMAVSFANDIKPLFREIDVKHMKVHGIALDDYTYMSNPDHATGVLQTVVGDPPSMPPGGPYWTAEQVALFRKWMSEGCQP
jgi:hypothetical protein